MGFSETMKAISDPQRREMLSLLKKGRLSAGEIVGNFPNLSAATVSYHLSLLKKASLITESKFKNFIYYELNASVFEEIMLWCAQFTGGSDETTTLSS
ncbi:MULTISPECIES: autorepressor SdpR family transcription factor [Sphaerochaeta]|jgi:ArsR family transcriptional regulator|uniref:Autorepressor SdpR family transcription factor n=2 Tax=root TaxID=1 RepID=A0ABY4DD26_9SPIR|nr:MULTISPECIES: autorepressor SdpR family transcription factor [Sphaerochaeta]MDT3358384.1 autorepressor SdpR family transcription factor [Spirochaetota bacterium]NLA96595.1 winged helix-turn-helix transcriptional regulator [Spirochaetales bacterium]MDD3425148.1 autorepressor SdpR family transcription factor [Sphaerochaeta sp.]MDD3456755.1 autorepressor SdpR family transcription factor [Sphaerochaeta sp.]MDX9983398.1 autorepressor SdpR family transcription factor [Sphaerochaeta sp.]